MTPAAREAALKREWELERQRERQRRRQLPLTQQTAADRPWLFVGMLLLPFVLALIFRVGFAGASVSPEHQATLDQHGYSVESEDAALPVVTTESTRCSQVKRRKLGTWIKNWNDHRMAGLRVIVTACAKGGEIKSVDRAYWCASPGHKWERVWGPYPRMFLNGVEAKCEFKRRFWVDQYWKATVRLRARVKRGTEHVIRWMKTTRWV